MIIDPTPMTVLDWTSQMTLSLSQYGPLATLHDPADWRTWALNACALLRVSPDVVNPNNYSDWKDWAMRFSQVSEPLLFS